MRDLEVFAADGPEAVPALDDRDPDGRDADDRSAGGRLRHWWVTAFRRHPVLRTLTRWPPTPGVAAVLAAVLAGGGVAMIMDRPAPAETPQPVRTVVVVQPESWLDVRREEPYWMPPAWQRELDRAAAARHPREATAVILPTSDPFGLFAVPPGVYDVRISCHPHNGGETPGTFGVTLVRDARGVLDLESDCDGELHLAEPQLVTSDYEAFQIHWFTAPPPGHERPLDASIVVSFTAAAGR